MADVVVVGGGLAGLTAARRLADGEHRVRLLEAREVLGGRVGSRPVDGVTCDRGFQVLFTAYPALQRELDLDALDLRRFAPGGVICRPGSRTVLADPFRDPRSLASGALSREVTPGDKVRTLALRRRLTSSGWPSMGLPDRSIFEYLRDRGFSRKFVDRFAVPLYGGITLDRTLSTSANVFEYTFRAMATGDIAVPAAGMGAIPAQLGARAREAGVEMALGEEVESVEVDAASEGRGPVSVRVETADDGFDADAVVVATNPMAARALTGVERIPTDGRSTVTQHYRLDASSLPTGDRIVLNAGGKEPNTVVQMSSVAPEYAPDGSVLLVASFVGADPLSRSDGELADATREALAAWFPERTFSGLSTVATDRIEFAQFAQPPGIHARLPGVRDPDGPVYLAGDYTRWSSIQGALESGRRAARAVDVDIELR